MPFEHARRVFGIAAVLATGCATHLNLFGPPVGRTLYNFWPPPGATSVWTSAPNGTTFGEVAERMASTLRAAGYDDARQYSIGLNFAHGFAFVTRLEAINEDGSSKRGDERWPSWYPEPPRVRWLEATELRFPTAGRYRIFLVALTDLPLGASGTRAPRYNDQTVMDGPDLPAMTLPSTRSISEQFRVGVYVYEYESASSDGYAGFVPHEERLSAPEHVERAGLSLLGASK